MTIGGQNINEVTGKTSYANQQLTFDGTAKQPDRAATASGVLIMHPDRQEVRLDRLLVTTQGMTWQAAPGPQPTLNYAHARPAAVTTSG